MYTWGTETHYAPVMVACGKWAVECSLCGAVLEAHLRVTASRMLEEHLVLTHGPDEVGH